MFVWYTLLIMMWHLKKQRLIDFIKNLDSRLVRIPFGSLRKPNGAFVGIRRSYFVLFFCMESNCPNLWLTNTHQHETRTPNSQAEGSLFAYNAQHWWACCIKFPTAGENKRIEDKYKRKCDTKKEELQGG